MLNFKKMHGLGNDFVIIDGRDNGLLEKLPQAGKPATADRADFVRFVCDRNRGVGCDQLIIMERSQNWAEMNFMRIYNPDGSEAGACGNATRCVADLLMNEDDVDNIIIETISGSLNCFREAGGLIRVEMGVPKMVWQDIPLSKKCDTLSLPLDGNPVAVNMGNPHCVFLLAPAPNETGAQDILPDEFVEQIGRMVEIDPLFPQRTNVEFVQILSPTHLRMRVWERGAGITQACGSGACAVAVAAIKRGVSERKVTVTLDGGDLTISWPSDDAPVSMTGPVAYVFDGVLDLP